MSDGRNKGEARTVHANYFVSNNKIQHLFTHTHQI
jgi:hypothetical protein